jgi:regulatory protein YycI of two-component signal transduction system YycFG
MSTRPFYDEATTLYWILKGRTEQGIPEHPEIGQTFTLEKAALFNYPIGQVLLVCNDDFETIAYAKVSSFEQDSNVTRVHCKIVKTLTAEEKLSLSNYLQTTQQLTKEPI